VWAAGELTAAAARDTRWQPGTVVDISLADRQGRPLGSQQVELSRSKRNFLVTIATAGGAAGEHTVKVVARPAGGSDLPVTETLRVGAARGEAVGEACVGTAHLMRRGPFSGPSFVATVDARFRRQERARLEVPVARSINAVGGRLLDRTGQPIAVPVNLAERQDGATLWLAADVSLAALAPGDYLIELTLQSGATRRKVLKALRIVP
jgi:hypothetical protein